MCYNLREIDFYESEDKQMAENKRPESMQRITTPELAQAFIDEQLAALRRFCWHCPAELPLLLSRHF